MKLTSEIAVTEQGKEVESPKRYSGAITCGAQRVCFIEKLVSCRNSSTEPDSMKMSELHCSAALRIFAPAGALENRIFI